MKKYDSKHKLLLAIVLFLFVFISNEIWNSAQKDKIITNQEKNIQNLDGNLSILKHNMMEQMASTGISVDQPSFLIGHENRRRLLSQMKFGSLLAVRISPLSCSICVDSTMLDLRKFLTNNKLKNRVIILTSYNTERDLVLFRRLHQMGDIEIFNIKENEISLAIENEKKPYMFIIDSTLISRSLFIPEKTISGLTNLYLTSIKKNFLK
ncbi:hypothetical protein [Flavobacterium sp. RS13.1]|uniref:hypothetical protein n=1 Tax=Flavobacterium sp. RS13.1 TaxID=3400345 RepID=UPI003AB01156